MSSNKPSSFDIYQIVDSGESFMKDKQFRDYNSLSNVGNLTADADYIKE
jgi:hypothetical protein